MTDLKLTSKFYFLQVLLIDVRRKKTSKFYIEIELHTISRPVGEGDQGQQPRHPAPVLPHLGQTLWGAAALSDHAAVLQLRDDAGKCWSQNSQDRYLNLEPIYYINIAGRSDLEIYELCLHEKTS